MRRESRTRSLAKSIGWRLLGILFLALVTYVFTRSWTQTTIVVAAHHGTFIIVYYLHERFWLWTSWLRHSKFKAAARVLLYEIVLGNLILGTITFAVTSEWKAVTAITLTYILNKLWMYYVYDKLWSRIQWNRKHEVVYTFVVGDLFHRGHLRALKQAKALGDCLIVGVLTDEAVEQYKRTPITSLEERVEIVASIKCVDKVVVQRDADPTETLKTLDVDVLTHGDDWPETFPGTAYMRSIGKRVVRTKYYKGQSTTRIIEKAQTREKEWLSQQQKAPKT